MALSVDDRHHRLDRNRWRALLREAHDGCEFENHRAGVPVALAAVGRFSMLARE